MEMYVIILKKDGGNCMETRRFISIIILCLAFIIPTCAFAAEDDADIVRISDVKLKNAIRELLERQQPVAFNGGVYVI